MHNLKFKLLINDITHGDYGSLATILNNNTKPRDDLTDDQAAELLFMLIIFRPNPENRESVSAHTTLLAKLITKKHPNPNPFFPVPLQPLIKSNSLIAAVQSGNKFFILLLLQQTHPQFTREEPKEGIQVTLPIQEKVTDNGKSHNLLDVLFKSCKPGENKAVILKIILDHLKAHDSKALAAYVHAKPFNDPNAYSIFAALIEAACGRIDGMHFLPSIKIMAEYGADVDEANAHGITPLVLAAERGNIQLVEVLLRNASQTSKDMALYATTRKYNVNEGREKNNYMHIIRALLKAGASINFQDHDNVQSTTHSSNALHYAAIEGWDEVVTVLIEEGKAPVDSVTNDRHLLTPLMLAAQSGQLSVVKILLQRGADIHRESSGMVTPTAFAIANNQVKVAIYLLGKGGTYSQTPLLALAISCWHVRDLEKLIAVKSNLIDDRFRDGSTLLHYACGSGNVAAIQLLLRYKPELIQTKDQLGRTPLMIAAMYGATDAVKIMLQTYAENKNHLDKDSHSALDHAVINGHVQTVNALLAAGCQANVKEEKNAITTVELAIIHQEFDILKLLILHEETDLNVYRGRFKSTNIHSLVLLCCEFPFLKTIHAVLNAFQMKKFALSPDEYRLIDEILATQAEEGGLLKKTKALLRSYKTEQTVKPEPTVPAVETKFEVDILRGTSGPSYLMRELGYSDESIAKLKKKHAADEVSAMHTSSSLWQSAPAISFAKGALSSHSNHVQAFRKPTVNCYLYVDQNALREQGCPEPLIKRFSQVEAVFDDMHVKKIQGDFEMSVSLPQSDSPTKVSITHELKLPGRPERIYLFQTPADNHSASLYWAFYFDPSGLHSTRDIKAVNSVTQTLKLYLPEATQSEVGPSP